MKNILMAALFAATALFVQGASAAGECSVVVKDGRMTVVAADGGTCQKGDPLRGASPRMGDVALASERFCETPTTDNIEMVKKDGVFERRFRLTCAYGGADGAPTGRTAGNIVFLR